MDPIKIARSSRGVTVRVAGEPAFEELESFVSELRPVGSEGRPVKVTWSHAERVHIAFLQALIALKRSVETSGASFSLSVSSEALQQTLCAYGMAPALGLEKERTPARRAA